MDASPLDPWALEEHLGNCKKCQKLPPPAGGPKPILTVERGLLADTDPYKKAGVAGYAVGLEPPARKPAPPCSPAKLREKWGLGMRTFGAIIGVNASTVKRWEGQAAGGKMDPTDWRALLINELATVPCETPAATLGDVFADAVPKSFGARLQARLDQVGPINLLAELLSVRP